VADDNTQENGDRRVLENAGLKSFTKQFSEEVMLIFRNERSLQKVTLSHGIVKLKGNFLVYR